jgi:hypothetical protein
VTFIAGFQIFASKFAKAFHIAPQGFPPSSSGCPRAPGGSMFRVGMVAADIVMARVFPPRLHAHPDLVVEGERRQATLQSGKHYNPFVGFTLRTTS